MIIFLNSILLVLFASHGSGSNATVSYKFDDICTNECDASDSSYWCGQRRMDPEGFISRCQQYTRYGTPCESKCHVKPYDENWCMTSVRAFSSESTSSCPWWEYCSLKGLTINNKKCWDSCEKRGEDYYWCHTNKNKAWDYCSPSGMVKPVQLTTKGGWCKNDCARHNENYNWCTKSMSSCSQGGKGHSGIKDSYWEYCSKDEMHTRYGKQCKEKCSMAGEDYYWCYTVDGSPKWDYCSAKPQDGVHVSLEIEYDVYGKECRSVCSKHGEKYFWCKQIGGRDGNWWDYCSPQKMSRYNIPCTDLCKRRGENYFWCHTQTSWDYCSPDYLYSGTEKKGWKIYLVILALWTNKFTWG